MVNNGGYIYVINLLLHSFGSTGLIGFWTLVTFILAWKGAKRVGHLKLDMMNKNCFIELQAY